MRLKVALLTFLFLVTLAGYPKNLRAEDSILCFDLEDSQRLYLCVEENPILREKIGVLEQRIQNLEKENDLLKKETEMHEKLTELEIREKEIYKSAFEREKDLTDRALKLAETSKSSWGIFGIIAGVVAAFCIGLAIGL